MTTLLHIGWARAASTAFRQNFLRRHPDIFAVDRSDGSMALQRLKSADDKEFQRLAPELRAKWEDFERRVTSPVICLTDEELSIGLAGSRVLPIDIAERCGDVFPKARTLAIVRDQVQAIRSFYALSYRVRPANVISFPDWVKRYLLEPSAGEDFSYLFSYNATLRTYLKWQRPEDVFVLPYHRLTNNYKSAYRDIAKWLGISAEACESLPNEKVNVSLPLSSLAVNGQKPAETSASNGYGPGQEAQIRALFQRDNAELAREFGVEVTGVV